MTSRDIIRAVCSEFGASKDGVMGASRMAEDALPRHVIMYLCRDLLRYSWPRIGRLIGGKDHSTALHAYRHVRDRLGDDPELRRTVANICVRLGAGVDELVTKQFFSPRELTPEREDDRAVDSVSHKSTVECLACTRRDKAISTALTEMLALMKAERAEMREQLARLAETIAAMGKERAA